MGGSRRGTGVQHPPPTRKITSNISVHINKHMDPLVKLDPQENLVSQFSREGPSFYSKEYWKTLTKISGFALERTSGYATVDFKISSAGSSTKFFFTGSRSAASNVSGYICVSDCRSRGRKFDPGQVPYFRGDRS